MPGSPHRSPRTARRGVTLPELLTVVAIIGVTLAIAVPMFRGSSSQDRLRAGARELAGALRDAQRLAIAERDNYCVVIDTGAMTEAGEAGEPVTRFWIARYDMVFDPATDPTDIADTGAAVFDGEFTNLETVDATGADMRGSGDVHELAPNIVVVAALISSTGFQGDDFAALRLNARRTEDTDLDGSVTGLDEDAEDVGLDGSDTADRDADGPVDLNEQDGELDPVYRVIRFDPQGRSDRAVIWLWDAAEGGTPIPANIPNLPASLQAIGLPPGMSLMTAGRTQENYFTVTDQTKDTNYYTIEVTPGTGAVQIYDYARGTGTVGPPTDWNMAKDGA